MRIYRRIGFQPVRGALTDRLEAYLTGTARLITVAVTPHQAGNSNEQRTRKK